MRKCGYSLDLVITRNSENFESGLTDFYHLLLTPLFLLVFNNILRPKPTKPLASCRKLQELGAEVFASEISELSFVPCPSSDIDDILSIHIMVDFVRSWMNMPKWSLVESL